MDQREKTGIRVWRCNKLVGSDEKKTFGELNGSDV